MAEQGRRPRTFSEESLSTVWYIWERARPVTEGAAAAELAGSSVPKDLRDTRLQLQGVGRQAVSKEEKEGVGELRA